MFLIDGVVLFMRVVYVVLVVLVLPVMLVVYFWFLGVVLPARLLLCSLLCLGSFLR